MAKKVSKSSPVVAALLRSLVKGTGRLSRPVAQRLGAVLGSLLWQIPNQFREASRRNVDRCFPELPVGERRRLVRESLKSTGLNVVEAGALWNWPAERLQKLAGGVENEAMLEAGLERGKGILVLAPHVGNWEYLSLWFTLRNPEMPLVSLYRPPRILELDEYLRQSRQRFGAVMAPASAGGLRQLARALQNGHMVGILPDQEPLKEHGVFAPFFGIPALTMLAVNGILRRFDPTVAYAFAQRGQNGKFRIRIFPPPDGLDDSDPVRAATQLNYGVEQCVRACPEQYMWSYRRFRTRPPEELTDRQERETREGSY